MADKPLLSPEALRQILDYDPDTGLLVWRKDMGRRARAGARAGWRDVSSGYVRVRIMGTCYKAHRVAWAIHHGAWPKHYIDHQDRDPSNNRLANLREATAFENGQNRSLQSNNASGVTGVSWDALRGGWGAKIKANGRSVNLGVYATKSKAAEAYRLAKRRLHEFNPEVVPAPAELRSGGA